MATKICIKLKVTFLSKLFPTKATTIPHKVTAVTKAKFSDKPALEKFDV
ncbi:MAG: hypothetical protein ACI9XR_001654 [Flavobacterium sp.]|jgi:hypothetical protein